MRGLHSHPMTPTPPSRRVDIGETLLALGAIVFGVLIVWQTTLIRLTPAYSKVGPRVIPYIVGAGLIIVGRLAGVRGAHRPCGPAEH